MSAIESGRRHESRALNLFEVPGKSRWSRLVRGLGLSKLSSHVAVAWLRSGAIGGLFAVLLVGQAWAVVAGREFWPFSNYPMYAHGQGSSVTAIQVDGVLADGTRYPVSIRRQLTPFDPSRILGFLKRIGKGSRGSERRVEATRALLQLYEKHRVSGRHDGPPLEQMEVFEASWRIAPFAANLAQPKRRRLLASTRVSGGEFGSESEAEGD